MKTALLLASLSLTLTACINTPRTHVLITPFAVAGIHSFAPANRQHKGEINLQARNKNERTEEEQESN